MTKWLPFLHPVWQSVGIALGFLALREGLVMRRQRRTRSAGIQQSAQRSYHAWLGKCSLWVLCSGYVLGIGELWLVRAEAVLRSAHFYFATVALALFCWGVAYGFALLYSPTASAGRRDLHSFLLPLALTMMLGVGLLGLKLLP